MLDNASATAGADRRQRGRERDRARILAAAEELFARQGFAGTSMQQLAATADFSVGKLYQHFRGKEAIFRDLLESRSRAMLDVMRREAAGEGTALARLLRLLAAVTGHARDHGTFYEIYLRENPANLEGLIASVKQEAQDMVAQLLAEAIGQGELRAGEDPVLVAAMVVGAGDRVMDHLFLRPQPGDPSVVAGLIERLLIDPLRPGFAQGRRP